MKSIFLLTSFFASQILFSGNVWAQSEFRPVRFVSNLIVETNLKGPKHLSAEQQLAEHKKAAKLIFATKLTLVAAKPFVSVLPHTHKFDHELTKKSKEVFTNGFMEAYILANEAVEEKMTAVEMWEVRVKVGNELFATLPAEALNSVLLEQPIGDLTRVVLSKPLALKVKSVATDLNPYHLDIELVPVTWQPVEPREENVRPLDLTPDIRGTFNVTHSRVANFEPIKFTREQSNALLGLPKRNFSQKCVAWLFAK